uniref:Putative secreted protein n=1 Tax=Amblyomma triste TaxID=251400 RepID=A0A023G1Q0_AMBTT
MPTCLQKKALLLLLAKNLDGRSLHDNTYHMAMALHAKKIIIKLTRQVAFNSLSQSPTSLVKVNTRLFLQLLQTARAWPSLYTCNTDGVNIVVTEATQ